MEANAKGKDEKQHKPNRFQFRSLHPNIFLGTASDRYAGWIGQIYTKERYEGRISKRTDKVGGKSFKQDVLPVDSVNEYFEHFPILEIDYTFYSTLLDKDGQPTKNFYVLQSYADYIGEKDRVVLKVPQIISAQKLKRGNQYIENETYLDPGIFTKQFYEPANGLLGTRLAGMIFEQEYQRKQDRMPAKQMADELGRFFGSIPNDSRYHLELRTGVYLSSPVFKVLKKYGVGQVLSHWTWLPRLKEQFGKANGRIFNSGNQLMIRLMTPIGMRYEAAYAKAHPFDRLADGMLHQEMINETVEIMQKAVEEDVDISILINNRAGGNAPLIAERIAEAFNTAYR